MAEALILQLRDAMSLKKADLGSVCGRVRSYFGIARPPQQNRWLSPLHEPLHWKAKRDPKGKIPSLCSPFYGRACRWDMFGEIVTKWTKTWNAIKMLSLQSFLRKGVSLGHVGEKSNPKDLTNAIRKCYLCSLFYGRACRWAMLGESTSKEPKGKEAWLFCRTSSGVRLCWELEEPKGPEGLVWNSGIFSVMFRHEPRKSETIYVEQN